MNTIDWIILGVVVVALIIVLVLFFSKWKKLRLLDLEAMPKAKIRSKKYQLIENRLGRKTRGARKAAKKVLSPAGQKIGGGFKNLHEKLQKLERKYRHVGTEPKTQEDKEKTRQKVAAMIEDGAKLFKEEKYKEAEEVFLDAVRISPKEVEAYEYLGEVYLAQKEYEHAIETLDFAKTLNPNDDRIYYDLAQVYQQTEDKSKAMEMLKRAVELAPKNPRNLHLLVEIAIEVGDRFVARETIRKFKEANPENASLDDLVKVVEDM